MAVSPSTKGKVGRPGAAVANGPEDDDLGWLSVDWQRAEEDVRRLRQRIFAVNTGTKNKDAAAGSSCRCLWCGAGVANARPRSMTIAVLGRHDRLRSGALVPAESRAKES